MIGAALLLCAVLGRGWLEQSMATHMLLQLPALALAGWLLPGARPALGRLAPFDLQGLSGFTLAMLVTSCTMVPRALELAALSWPIDALKLVAVFAAGAVLRGSFQRSNRIVQLFFIGNFCAMTAIVGMLYQDQPRQLCNVYTIADQAIAGIGLVVAACLTALAWCVHNVRALLEAGTAAPSASPSITPPTEEAT